jgi:single-strand DNA-binding protein
MSNAKNNLSLIGRVGKEIKYKTYEQNRSYLELTLAVSDIYRKDKTDWFKIKFWNKTAELANEMISTGDLISVIGSIHTDTWEDDSGKSHKTCFVLGQGFSRLTPKKGPDTNSKGESTGSELESKVQNESNF